MKKVSPVLLLFLALNFPLESHASPPPFPENDIIQGKYIVKIKSNFLPEAVVRELGIQPFYFYHKALNGFAAAIPDPIYRILAKDSRVVEIEPDKIVRSNLRDDFAVTWGLDRIDQRALPLDGIYKSEATGLGVTAYVIDTGIRFDHDEFGDRASFGFDAFNGNGSDCHGHGTHVSGTIGGKTYGVARDVKLKAVRVLDCNGSGSASGVVAGVEWVMNNKVLPAVANMSLGMNGISTAVDTAVANMINAGVATALAAGNDNLNACNYSPARVETAMTVGASNNMDAKSSFSNNGSCVDWFAPGEAVLSAWHTGAYDTRTLNGTSMASPHTAGVASLYLEKHKAATPLQVRNALLEASTKGVITSANSTNNHLIYSLGSPEDTTPPTVTMTAPANNARYLRLTPIALRANASDNVKVASVKFYVGNSLACTDTTAPYSCTWWMPFFPASSYTIKAIAVDEKGNQGVSPSIVIRPLFK